MRSCVMPSRPCAEIPTTRARTRTRETFILNPPVELADKFVNHGWTRMRTDKTVCHCSSSRCRWVSSQILLHRCPSVVQLLFLPSWLRGKQRPAAYARRRESRQTFPSGGRCRSLVTSAGVFDLQRKAAAKSNPHLLGPVFRDSPTNGVARREHPKIVVVSGGHFS
jgi:hypothetical protein